MYHYITLFGLTIHMTGVAIVLFLAIFLSVLYIETKQHHLEFHRFMKFAPIYILIIYLLGTYTFYAIEYGIIFPLQRKQLLLYLTPYKYAFHSIGIVLGIILGGHRFLSTIHSYDEKLEWMNAFLCSSLWALVPLGVFLLLGDTFIGLPTESGFFVSAIRSDSLVAVYDKVIPLGFYLSLLGLIGGGYCFLFSKTLTRNYGYIGFGIVSLALALLFIFQQYPRRLVMDLGSVSADIQQYFLLITATAFFIKGIRNQRKK